MPTRRSTGRGRGSLDWSYYSRGPLIAWLIRACHDLAGCDECQDDGFVDAGGPASGSSPGGLTAWGVFRLASLTTGGGRSALMAVLLLPAIPVLVIGGVIITSDTPLVCCWTWAAVWAYRAVRSQKDGALDRGGRDRRSGSLGEVLIPGIARVRGSFPPGEPGLSPRVEACWLLGDVTDNVVYRARAILIWNANHGWAGGGQLADRVGLSSRATWASIWASSHFFCRRLRCTGGDLVGRRNCRDRQCFEARAGDVQSTTTRPTADGDLGRSRGLVYLLCLWGPIWVACFTASLLG